MSDQVAEPPKGCVGIPGFIVCIAEGGPWLTQDGKSVTEHWLERGVWPTEAEARKALEAWS